MRIYLAGPMTGIKDFNFPVFRDWADVLRAKGHEVFSPAEKDEERYGRGFNLSETGSPSDAEARGFSLRQALADDTAYICLRADTIAMLPGWENSKGARAEWCLALALGHEVIYL